MTRVPPEAEGIATEPVSDCYLCGSRGDLLYQGLSDKLFGTPGAWNLKRCPGPECGLIWLDPMPTREDIGKAYRTYYTHHSGASAGGRKIDWPSIALTKISKPLYKLFMRVIGLRRFEKRWQERSGRMFLEDPPPGHRLLDVGCGGGDLLARMRRSGWYVEGVDVDAAALDQARLKHGLRVYLGSLEDLRFPEDSFDAITMNHVIEHVHEPVPMIRECFRLLRPGGRLVLVTPNSNSMGHREFGSCWRGLEPPRHLHLFTMRTLAECATRAGFLSVDTWTLPTNSEGMLLESFDIRERTTGIRKWEYLKWAATSSLKFREYLLTKNNKEGGEEVVLVASKEIGTPRPTTSLSPGTARV
ncbi:MAG: putative S-adenosylmethionine-dependent methyltransferase [Deltaproteobacteria bacterium]|nr:putative S-adenosylmethionine-dependent methyltransferase [Deltaproteobacteria bacterium]